MNSITFASPGGELIRVFQGGAGEKRRREGGSTRSDQEGGSPFLVKKVFGIRERANPSRKIKRRKRSWRDRRPYDQKGGGGCPL